MNTYSSQNPYGHRHIVSINQFTRKDVEEIFDIADKCQAAFESPWETDGFNPSVKRSPANLLPPVPYNFSLASLFFEASTRTRFSFEAAHQKLGGTILSATNVSSTSSVKGESLQDTIMAVSQFSDIICLRHPDKESAAKAAEVSSVPIINCGDGGNEHPTQALLDLYTIWREKKKIDGLNILFFGDTRFARTIRSLKSLLTLFEGVTTTNELCFHSQAEAGDQPWDKKLRECDVLYITRPQKERWPSPDAYKIKNITVSFAELQKMKTDAIVLHPGPRNHELNPQCDNEPKVAIWRQVKNGMYLRMALLKLLLNHI